MSTNFTPAELATLPPIFEGREAILVTVRSVSRVRIFDVKTNGVELFAKYQAIETPGLNQADVSAMSISAHASILSATRKFLGASYVDWRFFFDPEVIGRVLGIVAVLPPGHTYHDDYTKGPPLQGPGPRAGMRVVSPGPCASELLTYLRKQDLIEAS